MPSLQHLDLKEEIFVKCLAQYFLPLTFVKNGTWNHVTGKPAERNMIQIFNMSQMWRHMPVMSTLLGQTVRSIAAGLRPARARFRDPVITNR